MRKNNFDFIHDKKDVNKDNDTNIVNDENEEQNNDEDGCIDCGCHITKISSTKSLDKKEKRNTKDQEEREEEEELQKAKFLIFLGLTLTIPLVIIETFYHESATLTDYILLGLATPVQLIVGKPFYTKFYYSLIRKKFFTINTLVVLSTTIAYVYSLISMISGQELRFF